MITKEKKKEIVNDLIDKLSRQKSVIFFDYTGLKVSQFQELREKLREENIDCVVVKKSLIDLALEKAAFKNLKIRDLPGQIALVFGYNDVDEVLPAKILYDFSKKNEDLKIITGLIQSEYLENEAVISLAQLPTKKELLARLINSVSAPIYGLNNALQGNLRKLIYILKSCNS